MIAQSRFLGRNKGAKKKQARRKSKANSPTFGQFPYAQHDFSVIFGGERKKLDPYAIPKTEEEPKERIILSQDPIIRVMMEHNSDVKYEEAMREEEEHSKAASSTLSPSSTQTIIGRAKRGGRDGSASFSQDSSTLMPDGTNRSSSNINRRFGQFLALITERLRRSGGGRLVRFSAQDANGQQVPKVVIDGLSPTIQRQTLLYGKPQNLDCCVSFGNQGRVTSGCLWHAFRAITLGILLIAIGVTMAVLGFLDDQRSLEQRAFNKSLQTETVPLGSTSLPTLSNATDSLSPSPGDNQGDQDTLATSTTKSETTTNLYDELPLAFAPGLSRQDRFKLNNLSFAGPVIMGVGGFLIVAACVMTFEARDNAAKVVPSSGNSQNDDSHKSRVLKFRSSSSQTTFLDRNIVETLHVEPSSGSSMSPRGVTCQVSSVVGASAQVGTGPAAATCAILDVRSTFRPLAVPSNINNSASSHSTKRASFNGKLPCASEFEPGLALMDEIGRRALTNAFIQFTRNTANPSAYRDSLIYNIQPHDDGFYRPSGIETGQQTIPKCPSAPNIAHHKLDHNVTLSSQAAAMAAHRRRECIYDQAPGCANAPPRPPTHSDGESLPTLKGQYRVLTPTMYRSRMAAARQAISMDCEGSSAAKTRREGPSFRGSSPFQNRNGKFAQDSLDLELGASATGVNHNLTRPTSHHQCSSAEAHTLRTAHRQVYYEENSHSSMVLDLHVAGSAPVTLLVRDESRSTSGNRDTASNHRSPAIAGSPPSLHEQMSCEQLETSSHTSSSSWPQPEETSIFGGSGGYDIDMAQSEDEPHEKRIRDRRQSFRQSKMRQKRQAHDKRQRRNSDPSFDSSFDGSKDLSPTGRRVLSPSTISDDELEEFLVIDTLHQSNVKSQPTAQPTSLPATVNLDVSHSPGVEGTPGENLVTPLLTEDCDEDAESKATRMQTILEEDAAVTISLVGALGENGKKHFQEHKTSKSCDDPAISPPTPFGSFKRKERWSQSLADEMATLSFIDTSPVEDSQARVSRSVGGPVTQSLASLASEEETSSPDEEGTLKRKARAVVGPAGVVTRRGATSFGRALDQTESRSRASPYLSEPMLHGGRCLDPEIEELMMDIAEDSISLSPDAFPVIYSSELPQPPQPFADHERGSTLPTSRSFSHCLQSGLETVPMSAASTLGQPGFIREDTGRPRPAQAKGRQSIHF